MCVVCVKFNIHSQPDILLERQEKQATLHKPTESEVKITSDGVGRARQKQRKKQLTHTTVSGGGGRMPMQCA